MLDFSNVCLYNVFMDTSKLSLRDKARSYICIDLKSFYASVECAERGLDPMTTNLVVADMSRTEKTICLAITPAMKALGIKNRCRVFEIPKDVEYIAATPRMQLYMDYSATIYSIYLHYVSKDDIHVYSIDEAFLDVTDYLDMYQMSARELGLTIMNEIYNKLKIRATCGIGSNLYLTKIALDITAKHSPDFIGELTEESYRDTLWDHKPLTDFWMIGHGTASRLASVGITTMGQLAHAPEETIYHLFGINGELIIDHAWGREPTTIRDIKNYKVKSNSISSGQVLPCDYDFAAGKLIVKEMTDLLCLDLVEKHLVTSSLTLHISYAQRLGIPSAHGTAPLTEGTNADIIIIPAVTKLYEQIVDRYSPIRRVNITCNKVMPEESIQYSMFVDPEDLRKDRSVQEAVICIKNKYGKNAILKGMNLTENATTMIRNEQIGGHRK